jgi:transposase-like protein
MNVTRAGAKMLLCPSCAQIMRLVRQTQRFGKLLDVCTFECRDCGFSYVEECEPLRSRS